MCTREAHKDYKESFHKDYKESFHKDYKESFQHPPPPPFPVFLVFDDKVFCCWTSAPPQVPKYMPPHLLHFFILYLFSMQALDCVPRAAHQSTLFLNKFMPPFCTPPHPIILYLFLFDPPSFLILHRLLVLDASPGLRAVSGKPKCSVLCKFGPPILPYSASLTCP